MCDGTGGLKKLQRGLAAFIFEFFDHPARCFSESNIVFFIKHRRIVD